MNTLEQSQIFFLISSVGFVILWAMVAILLFYVINTMKIFYRIMDKIEKGIDSVGDTTKEMLEDMRDSSVFRFLFRKKKRSKE